MEEKVIMTAKLDASQIDLHQTFEELQKNIQELKEQYRRIRLRKILKFLLIGFLIGRGAGRRIAEITNKNRHLLGRVKAHLEKWKTIINLDAEVLNIGKIKQYLTNIEICEQNLEYLQTEDAVKNEFALALKKAFIQYACMPFNHYLSFKL